MAAKDNFSVQSKAYSRFRPDYPKALYKHLLQATKGRATAWDCATGNGQVAKELAHHFQQVQATDLSAAQIAQAPKFPNIHYQTCTAENTPFSDNSFDLITVGTALHWFDFEAFFLEVQRVAKPGATFACWAYHLITISENIDPLLQAFYAGILKKYWDPERQHVDAAYANIPFPFEQITSSGFEIRRSWSLADLNGYLNTWSAVQHCIQQTGDNPVDLFIDELSEVWAPGASLTVTFPVFMKVGIVKK